MKSSLGILNGQFLDLWEILRIDFIIGISVEHLMKQSELTDDLSPFQLNPSGADGAG